MKKGRGENNHNSNTTTPTQLFKAKLLVLTWLILSDWLNTSPKDNNWYIMTDSRLLVGGGTPFILTSEGFLHAGELLICLNHCHLNIILWLAWFWPPTESYDWPVPDSPFHPSFVLSGSLPLLPPDTPSLLFPPHIIISHCHFPNPQFQDPHMAVLHPHTRLHLLFSLTSPFHSWLRLKVSQL